MASGRQIEFPEKQTHVKAFEIGMLVFSIICVAIVLFVVLATDIGNEFRSPPSSAGPIHIGRDAFLERLGLQLKPQVSRRP